jgi:O-methyltransferase
MAAQQTSARLARLGQDLKRAVGRGLRRAGMDAARITQGSGLDPHEREVIRAVERFTMTSPERIAAVCQATNYVVSNEIPGAIVECGVWRGGSTMAAAYTLLAGGDRDRDLYLYDTYAGMTEPTEADRDLGGRSASEIMSRLGGDGQGSAWCYASLEDVTANLTSTGYPRERMHFVVGPVETTIPDTVPDRIALLRLDTDWYESTRHELEHLAPRLSAGGVLILDDYGHWQGARRAVDEYLEATGLPILLNRIDYTGRIGVMPGLPRAC